MKEVIFMFMEKVDVLKSQSIIRSFFPNRMYMDLIIKQRIPGMLKKNLLIR